MENNCMLIKTKQLLIIFTAAFILTACGGGGGGSSPPEPPPSGGGNEPTYTAGTFEDDDLFKNRCENPRTTTDINGDPYPDIQGSTLYENHWLRSWSNDTYLWYDEITDVNPANYNDPLDYFAILKTNAITASGKDKDEFHFTRDTTEYEQATQTGISVSYGIDWELVSAAPPRELYIRFIQPASPADEPSLNLRRGTKIIAIDGVDVEFGDDVDTLNAGLFPSENGETHTFTVQDVGSTDQRDVVLSATEVVEDPVPYAQIINTATGRVGYMMFNTFGTFLAEDELVTAMTDFRNNNVTDLVVDLRYNGGGFLYIASQLAYMIAGNSATSGKNFETLRFNDKHPTINPVTGNTINPTPFYNTTSQYSEQFGSGVNLPQLSLSRVYILTTDGTCSASEALINGLRGIDIQVVLIGSTTCGKPYGFYATDNCGTTYFTIQFDGINDKGEGGYADGFTPMNDPFGAGILQSGCYVEDDITSILGEETEPMLAAALNYRNTSSCPTILKSGLQSLQTLLPRYEGLGGAQRLIREQKLLDDPFKKNQ